MTELQKKELDILKEIIKVCEEYQLRYFAYGGTLIGAVRHKGFIPWDEDIDILMPRKDYDRFLEVAKEMLPDYLQLRTSASMPEYGFLFSKVHDIRTTFIGKFEKEYVNRYSGVFIDIFPIDGLSNNEKKRNKELKDYIFWLNMNDFVRPHHQRNNSSRQRLINIGRKGMQKFFRYNYFSEKIDKMARKTPYDSSKLVMDVSSLSSSCYKYIFEREWFKESVELQFEDIKISAPVGYDTFLRKMYGDYMVIPPDNQRDRHGIVMVDLENPYTYYQQMIREGKTLEEIIKDKGN